MVCWASPNEDSPSFNDRRAEVVANIEKLKADNTLLESLENLEKSLSTSSGVLPCVEGSIYKVPLIKIIVEEEEKQNNGGGVSPVAKKRKTATGSAVSAAKGKSPDHSTFTGTVVTLRNYPPSDAAVGKLKRAATVSAAVKAEPSEPTTSKQRNQCGEVIDAEKISLMNEAEWLDKGLKTPTGKIAKMLAPDSVDPKSVKLTLARLQLIGENGLDWPQEAPSGNRVGTLLVVLPLKFKGGQIEVRHGHESWSFDPAKSKSTVRCGWVAFAADAEVRIEAVTEGTTQALLVYHIVGTKKEGKGNGESAEKAVLDGLGSVAKQLKSDSPVDRFGIFLANKYNPKSFSVNMLKGQDRWLFNLLDESKYAVKLTFVRVLLTAWGFFDSRDWDEPEKRVQLTACGEEFMESEIWEMDMSKTEKWVPTKWKDDDQKERSTSWSAPGDHHKCRRLPWEMPWMHKSLFGALPRMTRVDREPLPSWSEGLWLCETYRVAALLVTIKPGSTDERDGPYTHFYPVAHPEPRGVSEREDMAWSRPVLMWRLPGDTQEELDEIDRNFWSRRNWVHEDLD